MRILWRDAQFNKSCRLLGKWIDLPLQNKWIEFLYPVFGFWILLTACHLDVFLVFVFSGPLRALGVGITAESPVGTFNLERAQMFLS